MKLTTISRMAAEIADDSRHPESVRKAARALARAADAVVVGPAVEYEQRRELVEERGQGITLNGHPARISGILNDYATVTDLTTGLHAEWSWDGILHVIDHADGAFISHRRIANPWCPETEHQTVSAIPDPADHQPGDESDIVEGRPYRHRTDPDEDWQWWVLFEGTPFGPFYSRLAATAEYNRRAAFEQVLRSVGPKAD